MMKKLGIFLCILSQVGLWFVLGRQAFQQYAEPQSRADGSQSQSRGYIPPTAGYVAGTGVTITGVKIAANPAAIDHNLLKNYTSTRHFEQTDITKIYTNITTGLVTTTKYTGTLGSTPNNSAAWDLNTNHRTNEDALTGLIRGNGMGVYSSITDGHANWDGAYTHKTTEDALTGLVNVDGAGNYNGVTNNSAIWNNLSTIRTQNGILKSDGASAFSAITDSSSNWNIAYVNGTTLWNYRQTINALNGILKSDGAGSYSAITDGSTNWNTAYVNSTSLLTNALYKDGRNALNNNTWLTGTDQAGTGLVNLWRVNILNTIDAGANVNLDALQLGNNTTKLNVWGGYSTLSVGSQIMVPPGTGFFRVVCGDADQVGDGVFKTDGTVTLSAAFVAYTSFSGTDEALHCCFYDAGSQPAIKNNLTSPTAVSWFITYR